MANSRTGRLSAPPFEVAGTLASRLPARARGEIARDVRGWLRWQETLAGFRRQKSGVDATPYVALYSRGQLRGCVGSAEGAPSERLARAFLSAVHDRRFGDVRPSDRADLVAEVSFVRSPRLVDEASVTAELELGTHGIGLARPAAPPVILLPDVARDSRLDARGMLAALRQKAAQVSGPLFLFEADAVVVRRSAPSRRTKGPTDAAAAWLASLVQRHGAVRFAIDARTGAATDVGRMHHGRVASVLHALAVHGGHEAAVARGRARLAEEIRRALAGKEVDGWPGQVAEVAGTLALAVRAGVPLRAELASFATTHVAAVAGVPWHAGQVVVALGTSAPEALWGACLEDLVHRPWAPWTVLGFHARREPLPAAAGAVAGLVDAVRKAAPYVGAVQMTKVAEVAITALTVEALLAYESADGARAAIRIARAFLARHQLLGDDIPAALCRDEAHGAFVAAPAATLLRGDVTAHALLALLDAPIADANG